ncbi:MAG: ECF-type sigma factor negative effector [Bacillales bacterium]|nr:ECF-type sigma factor negative effector [Bacillales bacterium]
MNFEARLRESLQEKGNELNPDPELKSKVINSSTTGMKKTQRRVVTVILAAALLIPTVAFASKSILADGIYGSFNNLKRHVATATMESYLRLDAKLAQAKGELGDAEYNEFIVLVKKITNAKLELGDKYGNINYSRLSKEKETELEKVHLEIQPYFDRLNEQVSSKELLSDKEYTKYIHSLMTHEEVLAKSGINPDHYVELKEIPPNLQAEFKEARDFIKYVNDKQIGIVE